MLTRLIAALAVLVLLVLGVLHAGRAFEALAREAEERGGGFAGCAYDARSEP